MEKGQLREALERGLPLAGRINKLDKKLSRAELPDWLSAIILIIIFTMIEIYIGARHDGITMIRSMEIAFIEQPKVLIVLGVFNLFLVVLLNIIPLINILTIEFTGLVGKIFFSAKQKAWKRELSLLEKEFNEATRLPLSFCDKKIIKTFIKYLDTYQAETLKECINLYKREERDVKLSEEIKDLKNEVSSLREEMRYEDNYYR